MNCARTLSVCSNRNYLKNLHIAFALKKDEAFFFSRANTIWVHWSVVLASRIWSITWRSSPNKQIFVFMIFFFFFFFFVNHFLSQSKGDKQHHVYEQHTKERYVSERMSGPAINYDHNLLKVIFYHLRDQLRTTINSNTQLDKHSSDYIITRVCLYCVQIQIESVECRGFNVSFDLCIW